MENSVPVSVHQPTTSVSLSTPVTTAYHASSAAVTVHVPNISHRPQPLSGSSTTTTGSVSSAVTTQPQTITKSAPSQPQAQATTPQTPTGHSTGAKQLQGQGSYSYSPTQSYQSKYGELLNVIEDLGREIKPTYAGSKMAQERLKKGIMHARALVRECLAEVEKSARQ